MGKWKLKHRMGILLAVLVLDSAVFGMSAGVMNYLSQAPEEGLAAGGQVQKTTGGNAQTADRPGQTTGGNAQAGGGPARTSSPHRQIALTFDDGPHPEYTPKLLDGLKKRNVRATFFLMGQNIPGNEELIRRMQEEGHLIGNHSYQHVKLTGEGEESVCEAVDRTSTMIAQITGQAPQYLRPPYGDWSEGLECRLDLTPVFWSVDSLDWKLQDTGKIVRRVEKAAGEGDIILMHDIFQTSVDAALALVDDLQKEGYEFVTVDELVIE